VASGGGAKFATGFVELSILDSSMVKRAHQMTAQVAGSIESQINSKLAKSFDHIGNRLQSLGFEASIAFAGVSLVVGNIVADGWEMAKSVSSARNIFHQFGMEANEATAFVDELYDKSNAWGTSFNTMLESSIKLWPAFGGNVDEIRYAMEGLYNITGKYHLSAEAVNGVMRAFVQISQKGKIQAEEMLQISEWGVDSWGLFSRALGISTEELRLMSQSGKLLAEDVLPKIYDYLNQNPEFAGMAVAQTATLSGQLQILSNRLAMLFGGPLADNNDALVAAFKNLNIAIEKLNDSGFVSEFLIPIINAFAKFTAWLATVDGGTLAMIAGFVALAAVIGPLLVILGSVFDHVGEGVGALTRFNNRIGETAKSVGGGAVKAFRYFRGVVQNTGTSIGPFAQLVNRVGRAVINLGTNLLYPRSTLRSLTDQIKRAATNVATFGRAVGTGIVRAVRAVPGALVTAVNAVSRFGTGIVNSVHRAQATLLDFANNTGAYMRRFGQGIKTGAVAGFRALVSGARSVRDAMERGLIRAVSGTAAAINRMGAICTRVARDGLNALGRNAGRLAKGGLNALKYGLIGAALSAGMLLASGAAIGPAIEDAGNQIISVIQALPALAQALGAQLPGLIAEIVATLGEIFPELISAIETGAPAILGAVVAALPILANALAASLPQLLTLAVNLIQQLADGLAANMPAAIEQFKTLFPALIGAVVTAIPGLITAIIGLVPPLLNALVAAIPVIVTGFVELFPALITAILTALPLLIESIMTAIPMLIEKLVEAIPTIIETVISMIPAIIETLIPMLPEIVLAFLLLIPQLLIAIVKAIPDIVTAVIKMIPQIAGALIKAIPEAVDAFMELLPKIKDAWAGAYEEFKDLGRELIEKIKDGLSAAWDSVSSWVSDKVSSIDLNPFSTVDASGTVSLSADTSAVDAALAPLASTFSMADAASAVAAFDAAAFSSAATSLGSFEVNASASVPMVDVRVYLGDTELTDIVRTEIRYADDHDRRLAAAGAL